MTKQRVGLLVALIAIPAAAIAVYYHRPMMFMRRMYRTYFVREPFGWEYDNWVKGWANPANAYTRAGIENDFRANPDGVATRNDPVRYAAAKKALPLFWPWYRPTTP